MQVKEISDPQYSSLWKSLIAGASQGSSNIVQITLKEVGNIGGEKYWRWYSYSERVDWCAIFVSRVTNQSGYIQSKVLPKFVNRRNGIEWFKDLGQQRNKDYAPKDGDIIFFDQDNDGSANHVGIVEKVVDDTIYTVEGNTTGDSCKNQNIKLTIK